MGLELLPEGSSAPRCSEFARSIGSLPRGSGLFLDRVVLVTVPLPWPKPAVGHPMLRPCTVAFARSTVPTRLLASEGADGHATEIRVYERVGESVDVVAWQVETEAQLADLAAQISTTPVGELSMVEASQATRIPSTPAATVLICTQGSHDLCCGTTGVALADELEATRPDLVVHRVSHLGGHRFAPTLLAFPEGRMWAFVDADLVDRIAAGSVTKHDVTNHARGWWGAQTGAEQVAECAVRAELADQPFVAPTIVASSDDLPEGDTAFDVTVGEQSWRVDVQVGREVPTIACEAPGGLPSKTSREYNWTITPR